MKGSNYESKYNLSFFNLASRPEPTSLSLQCHYKKTQVINYLIMKKIKYQEVLMNNKINITKGTIPIDKKLLNKYQTTSDIFKEHTNNYENKINIKTNTLDLEDISNLKISTIKSLAKEIFQNNNQTNNFYNDGNKILVNKTGIDESITKIFESRQQRELLREHLLVLSTLGDIIEHSKLVNQAFEGKGRTKYNSWNYYHSKLAIENNLYNFEFEVVSMANGENHYRVQKLEKLQNKKTEVPTGSTNNSTVPVSETSVSEDNIT